MSTFTYRSSALLLSVSLVAMWGDTAQAAAPKTDAAKTDTAKPEGEAAVPVPPKRPQAQAASPPAR